MEEAVKGGRPVLWMEADMIPVVPDWYAEICKEYDRGKRPYMGVCMGIPMHMNGTGVYPPSLFEDTTVRQCRRNWPWDCHIGEEIMPMVHQTRLIQHNQGNRYMRFNGKPSLQAVDPMAVLYHPSKDSSLIQSLNQHRFNNLLPDSAFFVNERYYEFHAQANPLTKHFEIRQLRGGTWGSFYRGIMATKRLDDQCELSSIANRAGLLEITKEQFTELAKHT